jgi:O-succinylbenzoate synthase
MFEYRRYRLPLRFSVRTAHGPWTEREGVLVRLEDETGATGFGEAAPIPWFGTETVDDVEAACRELGGCVDEARLAAVPVRLGCLRGALAVAAGEIAGSGEMTAGEMKADNAETSAGNAASETGWPVRHRHLGVAAWLPAGRVALTMIAPKAEAGFRVFKWKVGVGDAAEELALLDDVCGELPAGGKLRLDPNGAWDRRRAERWLERCAERPVEFVEQPIAATARGAQDLLQGLAADYPTPLALDESLVGAGDVDRWLAAGWPGIFVVKPSLLGDSPGALGRLAAAKAAVVFSSALETAVGAKAALRAAFAWAGDADATGTVRARALGFGVWPLFVDRRCDGPAAMPFLRWDDVERIDPEAVWTALN